jgi:hypothetical protein
MRANTEQTIVINAQTLDAPTTTLVLNQHNQAKLDAIRRSRLDGTYSAPEGMEEWQRMNPGKTASEWIIWRNHEKIGSRRHRQESRGEAPSLFFFKPGRLTTPG